MSGSTAIPAFCGLWNLVCMIIELNVSIALKKNQILQLTSLIFTSHSQSCMICLWHFEQFSIRCPFPMKISYIRHIRHIIALHDYLFHCHISHSCQFSMMLYKTWSNFLNKGPIFYPKPPLERWKPLLSQNLQNFLFLYCFTFLHKTSYP